MGENEAAPQRSKLKHNILIAVLSVCIAVMLLLWVVIGYLLYVITSFSRLPDVVVLEASGNRTSTLNTGDEYSIMTYNVGFGAYSPDYTFFMDTGIMKDGTPTAGVYGKARSSEEAQNNIKGAASVIAAYEPDFAIIQEVDTDSTRTYHVDQRPTFTEIKNGLYGSVFAVNYHSSFLMYPFSDPIGASNSGILTLSKHRIADSTRYAFPIDDGLGKLTDLDRCYSVTHIPVGDSGKYLAIISLHMSAYDEGGVIRKQQASMLKAALESEYAAGNYVIAGGDFNQDLIGDLEKFPSDQKIPGWVASYEQKDIPAHFAITADRSSAIGSCRGADVVWERDWTYTCVIDGFIVSDNITVKSVNILCSDTSTGAYAGVYEDFQYSDHNPVRLVFELNQV